MNETVTPNAKPKRVEINLNEEPILQQIKAAKLPLAAKKMAARTLKLCIEKNSGRLWFNMVALKALRHSPMIRDAFDALAKLQKAKIITYQREQREGGEVVVVEFTRWNA